MVSFLDSVTSQLLSKALDISLLKHNVIANNIANLDTENYTAFQVNLDKELSELKSISQSDATSAEKILSLKSLDVTDDSMLTQTGADVDLDRELVELNKNVTNYQALLSAKKNYGSILGMAIRGGK